MEEKKLQDFLKQSAEILQDFFPADALALIPLLYSTLIWAVKRKGNLEAEVSGLRLWLEPEVVDNKPDEFILDFFEKQQALQEAFKAEIKSRDMKSLRPAFRALYPVVGLEEPFLQSLFSEELAREDFRLIADQFDWKLKQALEEIKAAEKKPELWKALKKIGESFMSLGWAWLSDDELRAWLKSILGMERQGEEEEE
ncbi:MAG TPA: hypothetical protein PLP94_07685 [Candidatus Saccharicenans sp.]|nr:hypothetical protein [Candidatus Saccharicenans sp.]HOL46226.1 hypothetical protein [Candidatus Saccharicenans sp.]HOM94740.1 hypothetical protein [Candidatus Saccharicenans sp.]HPP24581.1 hypothetical protein [Candidatus Saccharicenans sp.]HRV06641.1 hypothetical protein [Candidatus Saccharicenans sp.]